MVTPPKLVFHLTEICLYIYIIRYRISYLTQVLSDFKAMIRRGIKYRCGDYGDLSQYSTAQQVAATMQQRVAQTQKKK